MDIKPIKTEADYEAALEDIHRLFNVESDTPESDRLEVLVTLVEAYEEKHHNIPLPDPIEAIEYHMESRGLTHRDLEPYIGSPAHVSEILNRRRPLSINMIRKIETGLGIPAEILIQPYELAWLTTKVIVRDKRTSLIKLEATSDQHEAVEEETVLYVPSAPGAAYAAVNLAQKGAAN